jgi:hypothetical protein
VATLAPRCKKTRGFRADAAAAAGNENDLAFDTLGHDCIPSSQLLIFRRIAAPRQR